MRRGRAGPRRGRRTGGPPLGGNHQPRLGRLGPPGATVEDWVEQAIALCAGDEICEVNVFEGSELVTHEIPVPEANRAGLKWVLLYRQDETPRVVVEEAHAEPGREPRTWTFDP